MVKALITVMAMGNFQNLYRYIPDPAVLTMNTVHHCWDLQAEMLLY